jgi:N-acetylglutamate synthase-like GNAT family acetyltransferase
MHSIRIGYLLDHPDFVEVLATPIWQHWRDALPEDATVEHRVAKLRQHMQKSQLPIALVAHQKGEALGIAALRLNDLEGREDLSPWLGGVFVLNCHRGQGVASVLCQAIKRLASGMKIESLYLFTHDQQRLYERLGWRTIETATWRGQRGNIMRIRTAGKLAAQHEPNAGSELALPCLRAPA